MGIIGQGIQEQVSKAMAGQVTSEALAWSENEPLTRYAIDFA